MGYREIEKLAEKAERARDVDQLGHVVRIALEEVAELINQLDHRLATLEEVRSSRPAAKGKATRRART